MVTGTTSPDFTSDILYSPIGELLPSAFQTLFVIFPEPLNVHVLPRALCVYTLLDPFISCLVLTAKYVSSTTTMLN